MIIGMPNRLIMMNKRRLKMSDSIVDKFTIIKTSEGFMIEYMDEYIHAPDGDNTFDTCNKAWLVLVQYLVGGLR